METAKEKAIREAYGIYYEKGKNHIDSDGWIESYEYVITDIMFKFLQLESKLNNAYKFRPKSLSGIETNQGWTRIESESDLPVKNSDCWVVWKLNGFITTDIFRQSDDKEYAYEQRKYWMEKYSHHQPIIKPQPPIY